MNTETIRQAVDAGICPWCGKGPYTVLAVHTSKVHKINRFDLREAAGITYSARITPDDYHERRSELSRDLYERGLTFRPEHNKPAKGAKRRVSPAGRAEHAAQARAMPAETRVANLRRAREGHRARLAEERRELRSAYDQGGNVYELADTYGVTVRSLRVRLRSMGVDVPDGRSDPTRPIPPRPKKPRRVCDADGCDETHLARGFCAHHYHLAGFRR